ncbi:MAG: 3-deoxy-manno-octulosonate cytidylyltransferase [Candidatus Hydrogenedentes bacterium]|nr:3-deoxy-manno-octulosonate cytidylyltransferase [Candidatus Hydrogenedentota bacterium]
MIEAMSVSGRGVLIVIPARYASTRFPGKMLVDLCGYPLVYHVYSRARKASCAKEVIVATDDDKILGALTPLGVPVVMTSPFHPSGTDRVAEVASSRKEEIIVNVQGDEPLLPPECIDSVVAPLLEDNEISMSTACKPLNEWEKIQNPNIVKVVFDKNGIALYFSRSPIPYIRDESQRTAIKDVYWQHIGIYAYRREFLLRITKLPQGRLERLEKLEQLRVLENGYKIAVVKTDYNALGVDTPEELETVRKIMEEQMRVRGD